MTIPLQRLYHFIHSMAQKAYGNDVIIMRFLPHGSKNIQDIQPLFPIYDWLTLRTTPTVWCHDQEPLNYEFYKNKTRQLDPTNWNKIVKQILESVEIYNINYLTNIFDESVLIHSEKRSKNLNQYLQPATMQPNNQLLSVYYWSHALIARDWYRYAEHETFYKKNAKLFLIYNRAWSGTREYRIKFADMLIEEKLIDQCLTFFNPEDNGKRYDSHEFVNTVWKPTQVLEEHLQLTTSDADSSADFCTDNYNHTLIEVVLETLFDDDRLHLTEKSLRPIACCQPFILAATHGSLAYLRGYGFKTFDTVWDESYDNIEDPVERMQAIIKTMIDISNWNDTQRSEKINRAYEIAKYNQKHFFSQSFFNLITEELQTNLTIAFERIKTDSKFEKFIRHWENLLKFQQVNEFLDSNMDLTQPTRKKYVEVCEFIAQYPKSVVKSSQI